MTFQALGLADSILKSIKVKGYTQPTPIQEQAIPLLLDGEDLLGCAQTGTGKTAAFSIPMIQMLGDQIEGANSKRRPIRALIVSPTRELAIQIGDSIADYGKFSKLRHTVIFGGVKAGPQIQTLRRGVDILVATPGRLLDLMGQGYIRLGEVSYFVLDEADQMLDMGFIHDIRRIIKELPAERQSLFFSATMPSDIVKLSQQILTDPASVTIAPGQPTAERVDQAVYFVSKKDKRNLLVHVLTEGEGDSALVFSRTKHGADKITRMLGKNGIRAEAIHGNKTQQARQKTLKNFRAGRTPVLVATDIAARGIDVADLSLVVNYDLPNVAETYVHRIGRTGRAQASGMAVSFCAPDEQEYLRDIQKLIRQTVPVVAEHPFTEGFIEEAKDPANTVPPGTKPKRPSNRGPRNSGPRNRGGRPPSNGQGPSRRKNPAARSPATKIGGDTPSIEIRKKRFGLLCRIK